jgi:hypothetical protein
VTFDESGKKCFKYSIISAIILLLGTATFLIIHYLYKWYLQYYLVAYGYAIQFMRW